MCHIKWSIRSDKNKMKEIRKTVEAKEQMAESRAALIITPKAKSSGWLIEAPKDEKTKKKKCL